MHEIIIKVLDERIAELCQENIERVLGYHSVIREIANKKKNKMKIEDEIKHIRGALRRAGFKTEALEALSYNEKVVSIGEVIAKIDSIISSLVLAKRYIAEREKGDTTEI